MDQHFVLSQKDSRPMYVQIMEQIKWLVANGDWAPGDKVPSIRELAVATRVSVITVKRAYQELEREGVLITQQGKGSFVAQSDDLGDQIMQKEIDQYLRQALTCAEAFGMSAEDLAQRLKQLAQTAGDKDE